MKKVSNILFLVGAIVSLVLFVSFLIIGLTMIITGNSPEFIESLADEIRDGEIVVNVSGQTAYEKAQSVAFMSVMGGVGLLVLSVLNVVNAYFSFVARKAPTDNMFVINIVTSLLCLVLFNGIAAFIETVSSKEVITIKSDE